MYLICFIFACYGIFANAIYWHQSLHIRFKIFAQIRIQIFNFMHNKYVLKRIFASERIFALYFLILASICFKIFVLKRIFKKLQANFTFKQKFACKIFAFKRIFTCKCSHNTKYSLRIASNYIGKHFTSLRLQLIFGSF
jgi:hypothetical protein